MPRVRDVSARTASARLAARAYRLAGAHPVGQRAVVHAPEVHRAVHAGRRHHVASLRQVQELPDGPLIGTLAGVVGRQQDGLYHAVDLPQNDAAVVAPCARAAPVERKPQLALAGGGERTHPWRGCAADRMPCR
eukprot:scaffold370_cov289-Prasinococcus_capsulatus_cf.AAC.7